ncbi:DinB family protein [Paenibacillus sp. WQ 127069]|uniref:DinB family protein n=1 Tax=Paenibacillus baimaensis TaxID=2982185 RepID=A0ABT2ULI7_9BACL|nr:DinB family protein [Paenibacillus sp. WQ 127069]MCU6795511.1 DinB family protein [Paenibacillus sp. WQ 127069]
MSIRPAYDEYNEYFERYVKLVPEGNIREILTQSLKRTTDVFSTITEDQANYQYAPGKWKLKEVLGHITDNERIMSYRLLRIARGDKTPLSGYDQDDLMSGASFDTCPMSDLLEDYAVVRQATLTLLRGLSEDAWARRGIVNGNESSTKAWAYIIAGHELHHMNTVKERYLNQSL